MAKLIKKALAVPVGMWKGGAKGGAVSGLVTGATLLTGMNPFVAYLLSGLGLHAYMNWQGYDNMDKRIVAFESVREALIQLFVAE